MSSVVWCLKRAERDNNFDTEIIDSWYFDWVGYKTITPRSFICLFMKCFARIEFAGKKIIIGTEELMVDSCLVIC